MRAAPRSTPPTPLGIVPSSYPRTSLAKVVGHLVHAACLHPFLRPWRRGSDLARWSAPAGYAETSAPDAVFDEIVDCANWLAEALHGMSCGDRTSEQLARAMMPGGATWSGPINMWWRLSRSERAQAITLLRERSRTVAAALRDLVADEGWLEIRSEVPVALGSASERRADLIVLHAAEVGGPGENDTLVWSVIDLKVLIEGCAEDRQWWKWSRARRQLRNYITAWEGQQAATERTTIIYGHALWCGEDGVAWD